MVTPIANENGLVDPDPKPWVQGVHLSPVCSWDIAPDETFAVALEKREAPQLHLVQNFFAVLERLVPTD